ncbi:ABC transporter ATP-binding protein [Labedella phragmitis]|uniref:ABC transporter ATP-binding protein n=1 Tax=Labedella phragmitis TaxID=2498849 RepID=A0A3S3Z9N7_9MICO|nr:ABC transporter ATP-binding protein [Labedella phragmitis]RWZ51893.1 ABC transporter ATP-binding protein [Labedella phragmitis]
MSARDVSETSTGPLLELDGLTVSFGSGSSRTTVVRDVSFSIAAGECVAIVGESGSGKSVTARSILGLAGPGAIVEARRLAVDGHDVSRAGGRELRRLRGDVVGLISQDALVSLDPLRRVAAEVGDPLRLHRDASRRERDGAVIELLDRVGIPRPEVRARQYPHQLSGGLRQRALIASAIAAGPRLLIADEPTTALDMTVQAGILRLLGALRDEDTGLLLISHDLGVVAAVADRVVVMRNGSIVDEGATAAILAGGSHAYTRQLVRAVPAGVPRGTALLSREPLPTATTIAGHTPAREGRGGASLDREGRAVLSARGVAKTFGHGTDATHAVRGIDLDVHPGETIGVVGESGGGKTTLGRILLALTEPDVGTVLLDGEPWSGIRERERRSRRRLAGLVSQDTSSSVDPRWSVGRVIADALPPRLTSDERRRRVRDALADVALDPDLRTRSPRTLSGGQRQRVGIARALAAEPRVIVLDEPVSALDATVAAGVLDLLDALQRDRGLAYVLISHDLSVVRHMSDRVAVMLDGVVVETGPTEAVFSSPSHEYTRRLLADVPVLPPA